MASPRQNNIYNVMVWFLFLAGLALVFEGAHGAGGGCGQTEMEILKLIPCLSATKDSTVAPSSNCCNEVKVLGQNPSCLCAVLLSNIAKSAGVKPEIAITIPKRCNLLNRPVGFKCGEFTLP
ncbi:putative lipid-transfer protein DIR1 [Impatiens glandulifera]|uniref:putative lipid-transfer protein DIR1 n=1 Tax=Impatiens glandulifera TaxID=253017 RepID=UPI001FB0BD39|nr:putative lipid-transfer protein DIR1 [Impatiens glandulifera]